MRILEVPQRPGLFDLALSPATPSYVLDEVARHLIEYDLPDDRPSGISDPFWHTKKRGLVVAMPGRAQTFDLASARYVGWLETMTGTRLGGAGLAAFMQSDQNTGAAHNDFEHLGSLSAFFTAFKERDGTTPPTGSYPLGGLTIGTVTTTGLQNLAIFWYPGILEREMILGLLVGGAGRTGRVEGQH